MMNQTIEMLRRRLWEPAAADRSFVIQTKDRRATSVESRLIISNRPEHYRNLLPILKTREGVGFFVRSHKPDYAGSIPASGTI